MCSPSCTTASMRLAAAVALLTMLAFASPAMAEAPPAHLVVYAVREEDRQVPRVTVRVGVWDDNARPVTDLQPTDFEITDAGAPGRVLSASLQSNDPISVVLVVDNSRDWLAGRGDGAADAQARLRDALQAFVDGLAASQPSDVRFALLSMDSATPATSVHLQSLSTGAQAARTQAGQLALIPTDMPLKDRLSDGLHLLAGEPNGRRRILLAFTDGNDVRSPITYDQILSGARLAHVQVFAVGVAAQQAAQLDVLASQTGGAFRDVQPNASVRDAMTDVAHAIESSYLISYAPSLYAGPHHAWLGLAQRGGTRADFTYFSNAMPAPPDLHGQSQPEAQSSQAGIAAPDGRTPLLFAGIATALGAAFLVTLLVVRSIARRRRGPAVFETRVNDATRLFLEPRWPHQPAVAIRPKGVLGRGPDAYGFDPDDPFVSGVSRRHLELEVRSGRLYARACRSATVGTCVVDVQDNGRTRKLSADVESELRVGMLLTLGAYPAPGYDQRPALTIRGENLTTVHVTADDFAAADANFDTSDPHDPLSLLDRELARVDRAPVPGHQEGTASCVNK